MENVTHEEAVATLKATQDRVVLLVAKPEGTLPPPPPPASDHSLSPQRKLCSISILCIYIFGYIYERDVHLLKKDYFLFITNAAASL